MPDLVPPLVPVPPTGRRFVGHRQVRLGDVTPEGVLRLDALTRYTQDVSNDDTSDAGLVDDMSWVVRRTTVDVLEPAHFGERLELVTFCGGLGPRWAERRLHVTGDRGGAYEVATLWVHLDPSTGRPKRLPEQFVDLYGEAAQGRSVTARLHNPPPPPGAERRPWVVRAADLDLFGHVNNAAYWAAIEELRSDVPIDVRIDGPVRAIAEYGPGLRHGTEVALCSAPGGGGWAAWLVEGTVVHASFALTPLAHPG